MRKVVIHSAGGYDKLKVEEHPDPTPRPGEVVVRVAAAGINFADTAVRMGLYDSAKEFVGWPITPGFEVAGDVVAVGEGVTKVRPGQRVIALTLFGGYSSRVVVPEHQVFECPDALDFAQAAGVAVIYLTAYYALFELCKLRPGDSILVHSAAGGVGSAVLQIAKQEGYRAVGVVGSSKKIEAAKRMGAEQVIDKSTEDLWARAKELEPKGYDAVLDANGVETLKQSFEHTKMAGRLVVYGFATMMPKKGTPNWIKLGWDFLRTPRFSPFDLLGKNKSVMAFNLSYLFDKRELLDEAMGYVLDGVKEGRFVVPEVTRFAVDKVADAHRAIESGTTVRKLVITFGG
ncbi:MAG: zinc-binding dehydrogenase [Polyangiaceae bacterium]|nr:zinc-binding dehydrogenase [Polyangiaceae bacterium]